MSNWYNSYPHVLSAFVPASFLLCCFEMFSPLLTLPKWAVLSPSAVGLWGQHPPSISRRSVLDISRFTQTEKLYFSHAVSKRDLSSAKRYLLAAQMASANALTHFRCNFIYLHMSLSPGCNALHQARGSLEKCSSSIQRVPTETGE